MVIHILNGVMEQLGGDGDIPTYLYRAVCSTWSRFNQTLEDIKVARQQSIFRALKIDYFILKTFLSIF